MINNSSITVAKAITLLLAYIIYDNNKYYKVRLKPQHKSQKIKYDKQDDAYLA